MHSHEEKLCAVALLLLNYSSGHLFHLLHNLCAVALMNSIEKLAPLVWMPSHQCRPQLLLSFLQTLTRVDTRDCNQRNRPGNICEVQIPTTSTDSLLESIPVCIEFGKRVEARGWRSR